RQKSSRQYQKTKAYCSIPLSMAAAVPSFTGAQTSSGVCLSPVPMGGVFRAAAPIIPELPEG
ncbi:MAG: hypothetical protein IKM73_01165, partial [Acidaminococcaceae bacterium]|nr:hypothetical protein [Acidaminococcaceae bacterium]